MYRRKPSFALAEVSRVAFFSDLLQHPIRGRSGQGLPGAKHPDAVLLRERTHPADRTQGDLFTGALHFQCVAGFQMELFPQRLRNHDAPGFINSEAYVHFGTIHWVDPAANTIVAEA